MNNHLIQQQRIELQLHQTEKPYEIQQKKQTKNFTQKVC